MKPAVCELFTKLDIHDLKRRGEVSEKQSHIRLTSPTGVHDIALARSVCPYGGSRPWFRCPCGERVGVIYASVNGIGCRYCMRISNSSRWETLSARLRRRLVKLRARLDEGRKPKWMRWPTYERILTQIEEAESMLRTGSGRKTSANAMSEVIKDA